MKRVNPLGTFLGIGLTILLFIGLGFSLWYDRGLAFSPGALTAKSNDSSIQGFDSHAAFEKQCRYCHTPLTSSLAQKCLDCHVDVSQQQQSGQGIHDQISYGDRCAACHPDHKGRNFDPTLESLNLFDHSDTSFSLKWHQTNADATPMECNACHENNDFAVVNNQTCLACHVANETSFESSHVQAFGPDCQSCHDGSDKMMNFSHETTGYPLEGQHEQVKCIACHQDQEYKGTPQDCGACHSEPSLHQGVFAQSCDTCHTPNAWVPARLDNQAFDHATSTTFSLALHQVDYSKQEITCTSCHPQDLTIFSVQTCSDCHTQHDQVLMEAHQGQYGSQCLTCHDGVDRLHNFDHAIFFTLDGKHATLQCDACHANQVYRGTPDQCSDCHLEPEIHAGVFGLQCADCHTAEAWSPASLLKHAFPLNHGLEDQSTLLQCDACHVSNYIEYTCNNCHEHTPDKIARAHQEEGISAQELPTCAKCHADGSIQEGDKEDNH